MTSLLRRRSYDQRSSRLLGSLKGTAIVIHSRRDGMSMPMDPSLSEYAQAACMPADLRMELEEEARNDAVPGRLVRPDGIGTPPPAKLVKRGNKPSLSWRIFPAKYR